jgi:hypothetical protein
VNNVEWACNSKEPLTVLLIGKMILKSYLEALEGLTINEVFKGYECSLQFVEKDVMLTISTEFEISDNSNISTLQELKVERVEETENAATLYFSDGRCLRIDLREEAHEGPEALVLHRPGEPIVVWN